jgi:protein TonB
MSFLDTEYKRKSMRITIVIHLVILFLLFFVLGLKYMDPPLEGGIAVNFGTMDQGSGNIQPKTPVKSAPKQTTPPPVSQPKSEIKEKVITQDNEDAPVIKNEKPQMETREVPVKEQPKEVTKPTPKPDKSTTDALDNLINAPKSDGQSQNGEGPDNKPGDKGNPNGDPNAKGYYGTGKGLDGDGNYRLGGRKAINKAKEVQDCNEAGKVVVDIVVNQSGTVISAVPGVRGTKNNSRCLLEPAKRAALATRFNPDPKAPAKQYGQIIYNFKLSQ